MVRFNGVDAVPQDLVHRLHHTVRRQTAVLFAEVHAAAAGVHADAQLIGGGKLRAQQVAAAGGEDVVVVEAGGAAVLHQLTHAGEAGQADDIGVQILPDLVQCAQPVEQLHVLDLGQVAGEHLVQVVVGVDEAGVAEHVAAVDDAVGLHVQIAADGLDETVLTVEVGALQDAVAVITGDQLGDVPDKQGGHGVSSLKIDRKKEQAASGLLFLCVVSVPRGSRRDRGTQGADPPASYAGRR